MGLSAESIAILECINKPAFISDNATIIHTNQPAAKLGLTVNTDVSSIINEIGTESCTFTFPIKGKYFTATASAIGAYKLYILDQTIQQKQIDSLLRAAQHIRVPLSALNSYFNSIKDKINNSNDSGAILTAQKATKQLFSLQRTVRNMSDIENLCEVRPNKLKNINACAHIKEIAEKLTTHLANCNVSITYSVPENPIDCSMDTELIERAIYNMVSNSLKAGSQNIHIELSKTSAQHMNLSVTDDGSGISDVNKSKILSKFQTDTSLNFDDYGLGLGMMIIHCAAIAHDGTLLISNVQPHGCKITMSLTIFKETNILRQNPILITIDTKGGTDQLFVELADFLPPEDYQ